MTAADHEPDRDPAEGAAAAQELDDTTTAEPEPVTAQQPADPGESRWHRSKPWLTLAFRLILAAVLIGAAWPKLMDPDATVVTIRAYEILPISWARPFAYGLPIVELGIALLLILGLATRIAAIISALMMAVYIVAIISVWARGLSIDCGCFGTGGAIATDPVPGYIRDIVRDIALLAMALFVARWPYHRWSLDAKLGLTSPESTARTAA